MWLASGAQATNVDKQRSAASRAASWPSARRSASHKRPTICVRWVPRWDLSSRLLDMATLPLVSQNSSAVNASSSSPSVDVPASGSMDARQISWR